MKLQATFVVLLIVAAGCEQIPPGIDATIQAGVRATIATIPTPTPTAGPTASPTVTATATSPPTPTQLPSVTPSSTPNPTPQPIVLRGGAGDTVSPVFYLELGVVILEAEHKGDSNFTIHITPTGAGPGELKELSVNTIGQYLGARVHLVSPGGGPFLVPGPHQLEVTASGPWSIQIQYERSDGGVPLHPPLSFAGEGDEVLSPLWFFSGTTKLKFTHDGASNFIVRAFSIDGLKLDLLVSEIGPYEGTVALGVQPGGLLGTLLEPGVHVIEIQADGRWSMEAVQ